MSGEIYTYVYELYINEGRPFYVGKTLCPVARWGDHCMSHGRDLKMKIIGKYIDLEHFHIYDYLKRGIKLINKEVPNNKEGTDFHIGQIIERKFRKPKMSEGKLTSIKIPVALFTEFKIMAIRNKMNLQKLVERSMFLYMTDDKVRDLINGTFSTELSGSI